ncbi:hypothetical protein J1N35_002441 [Gossypium stocksii]|uniref:Reverse transcriptase domain-containing protein n=1 Tax=Gossypium stocksii TaxID=47602 RepID=A0A9D3WLY5_9ROSI|nr:hypothetical protein J1N35_002441 [Gossypium stocksii]
MVVGILSISLLGLRALMRMALREGSIKGAKVSRGGLSVSHLLFVNDSILFGEASERGAQVLKSILREYERCSGEEAGRIVGIPLAIEPHANFMAIRTDRNKRLHKGKKCTSP